ncbi:MAG: tRNA threonylcarbamoyladenosine biosynthesis protein RimN [Oceanospirillaceae bacterium]|nr:tRNA threonylcarbamoyladenosine biosynthesis protein RimN [Oceanospirillaceae bacterium]MBT11439.1 tRNA threonylcarbamoyladenosine biosynthesis protein RimN [Oceanospirillaceae bacterium]|tara:strand:+ start:128575 stop:129120 length:546 start_codon:yes stop_codon:yes gene_type:complete
MNSWHLSRAVRAIESGGVIACPTEAVWGLSCDPADNDAIQRILDLKQRPWQKGVLLVASSLEQLHDWIEPLSDDDLQSVWSTWPGPVTWVLPCKEWVSPMLRGIHNTLAVRISGHPLVQALCHETGPLVSTSANPAGREPARSRLKVRQYFHQQLDYILPGELGGRQQPSEIRTLNGQRLR